MSHNAGAQREGLTGVSAPLTASPEQERADYRALPVRLVGSRSARWMPRALSRVFLPPEAGPSLFPVAPTVWGAVPRRNEQRPPGSAYRA